MNQKFKLIIMLFFGFIMIGTAATLVVKYNETKKSAAKKIQDLETIISNNRSQSEEKINQINQAHQKEIKLLKAELSNSKNESTIYHIQSTLDEENKVAKSNQTESYLERMERLKQEDPEKYKQMLSERKERYNAIEYDAAERTALLLNEVDISLMNDDELLNHEQLIGKMGQIFELTQELSSSEPGSDREIWQELGPLIGEVRPMLDMERKVILKQSFTEYLNLSNDEANKLTDHIEEIIKFTTIQPGRRRPNFRN